MRTIESNSLLAASAAGRVSRRNLTVGLTAMAVAAAAAAPAPAKKATVDHLLTEKNRRIVLAFAELFYGQRKVRQAFETYVSDAYIQHNPSLPDSREAAIEALEPMFNVPGSRYDVQRILVDGDLAAIHLHGRSSPEALGGAVVDMFRIEAGKIVEHWDVVQAVPAKSANAHPMF